MRPSRALRRRLDPWAVMLLGVLLALGVIILLATPGPWHRVVPSTPRVQVGSTPPTDVAVFVNGRGADRPCTAAIWVHLRYDLPSVTAVVVPVRIACRLPTAGVQPLDEIVSSAGPAVAAEALAERLGVAFDGWLALGQPALRDAFPTGGVGSVPQRRLQLRRLTDTWGRQGDPLRVGVEQVRFLLEFSRTWRPAGLNKMAFTNYVLGAPDALTDMKSQAVSAAAENVARTPRRRIVIGALPMVAYANEAYERWLPEPSALLAYRASFAAGAMVPAFALSVDGRSASDTVVILVEERDAGAEAFAAALGKRVEDYARRRVRVATRVCTDVSEIHSALRQAPGGGPPPLAAVVAFGQATSVSADADRLAALTRAALGDARIVSLPAVVGIPAPTDQATAAVAETLTGAAEDEGFPYAARTAAGLGQPVGQSASPTALQRSSGSLTAECLVRAVQPAFFSPRLTATRLGVGYYGRSDFEIVVAGPEGPQTVRLLETLRAMGYLPERVDLDEVGGDPTPGGSLSVLYSEGYRTEALCVADDLGLARDAVSPDTGLSVETAVIASQ